MLFLEALLLSVSPADPLLEEQWGGRHRPTCPPFLPGVSRCHRWSGTRGRPEVCAERGLKRADVRCPEWSAWVRAQCLPALGQPEHL